MQFQKIANDPARVRKAKAALAVWLESIGIDPQSDCGGIPAVASLYGRLNNGRYSIEGDVLKGAFIELEAAAVKKFLWGEDKAVVIEPETTLKAVDDTDELNIRRTDDDESNGGEDDEDDQEEDEGERW